MDGDIPMDNGLAPEAPEPAIGMGALMQVQGEGLNPLERGNGRTLGTLQTHEERDNDILDQNEERNSPGAAGLDTMRCRRNQGCIKEAGHKGFCKFANKDAADSEAEEEEQEDGDEVCKRKPYCVKPAGHRGACRIRPPPGAEVPASQPKRKPASRKKDSDDELTISAPVSESEPELESDDDEEFLVGSSQRPKRKTAASAAAPAAPAAVTAGGGGGEHEQCPRDPRCTKSPGHRGSCKTKNESDEAAPSSAAQRRKRGRRSSTKVAPATGTYHTRGDAGEAITDEEEQEDVDIMAGAVELPQWQTKRQRAASREPRRVASAGAEEDEEEEEEVRELLEIERNARRNTSTRRVGSAGRRRGGSARNEGHPSTMPRNEGRAGTATRRTTEVGRDNTSSEVLEECKIVENALLKCGVPASDMVQFVFRFAALPAVVRKAHWGVIQKRMNARDNDSVVIAVRETLRFPPIQY